MSQTKRSVRSEATRVADLVRKAVDDGAKTAEEIHKAVADLPLEVMMRLDIFEKTAKDVKRVQDHSIGAIYDFIRRVNKEVTGLAEEMLEKAPSRRKLAAKKAAMRKRATAMRKRVHAAATA
jgi:hypothetical protein